VLASSGYFVGGVAILQDVSKESERHEYVSEYLNRFVPSPEFLRIRTGAVILCYVIALVLCSGFRIRQLWLMDVVCKGPNLKERWANSAGCVLPLCFEMVKPNLFRLE
jgi:hypothetical protein